LWRFGIFAVKRDEVAGGWKELLKAELCNLSKHTRVCSINFVICVRQKKKSGGSGERVKCRALRKWEMDTRI
jgi:hypothetical protein